MLKIYLQTVEYEVHNENQIIKLSSDRDYVIRDEDVAVPKTIELGVYTNEAHKAYAHSSNVVQKKKGKLAYFYGWPYEVYFKEWVAPDAKLVLRITYNEGNCSMKELMNLPATDVIAYLKQEYIMPS